MTKQQKLEKLLAGCHHCLYDEDGGCKVFRYCSRCAAEIALTLRDVREESKSESTFDNGLTLAEGEMFQLLEEECAELIQAVSKIRRHGKYSTFVNGDPELNMDSLHEEAADVIACLGMLSYNVILDSSKVNHIARTKLERLKEPGTKRIHHITREMIP